MYEFDTDKYDADCGLGLETEHGSYAQFDASTILLNGVIHVFAVVDGNELSGLL